MKKALPAGEPATVHNNLGESLGVISAQSSVSHGYDPQATVKSLSEEEAARLSRGPNSPDAVGDAGEAGTDSLSADDLFYVLQNACRRAVLRYLRGREGPVRMQDVAEQVPAWEHDTTVAQLTSTERQRVYISLYQSHLETLEDAGVIAYNKPRGMIEPQPGLEHVASYLDRDGAGPADTGADVDPWPRRYLGAAAGSTLLLLGAALELPVVAFLPEVAVGVLILLLFTGLTVAKLALDGGEPTEERGVPAGAPPTRDSVERSGSAIAGGVRTVVCHGRVEAIARKPSGGGRTSRSRTIRTQQRRVVMGHKILCPRTSIRLPSISTDGPWSSRLNPQRVCFPEIFQHRRI